MHFRRWTAGLALAMACVAATAFAQTGSSTTALSGVVVDSDGGLIPGASVTVKNTATGETLTAVTNNAGAYSFPALSAGTYSVTISLPGFKTAEYKEVRLNAGTPGSLKTTLEVGGLTEVVEVRAGTDLVRAQTPTVSSTVNADYIKNLPRGDRNALNFLIFLPGVETIGTNARGSTISGLPQNTINITIDGISSNNLLQSGDGFFSMVTPRLDAVEEVTLTTATAGADATGQGAVQVRFVTRSGTNRYQGTVYNYLQHRAFNTNTYFNRLNGLPKPENTNLIYGGSFSGPIRLPNFDGRGKAFFFFNQEETYTPRESPRTRTIARPHVLTGDFRYNLTSPTTRNVLQIAAANGFTSTPDPTIMTLLNQIDAASRTTGVIQAAGTNLNTVAYDWLVPVRIKRHNPTTNITVNLTPKHRLQGSYYWQRFIDSPDTLNNGDAVFPGFPAIGETRSFRTTASINLRSTLSSTMVNELRGGWAWQPEDFFGNTSPAMYANQGGFSLGLGFGLTSPANVNGITQRNTWNYSLDDSFNWLKGSHAVTVGGSFTRLNNWNENWNNVPTIGFGIATNDPAEAMFTTANFPGSSTGDRNNARALYALLTGRVTSINATGRLNTAGDEYIYNGHLYVGMHMDEYSLFMQDQWRWKPTVTVTAGLRYQLQRPMVARNSAYTMSRLEDACGPSGLGDGVGGRQCNLFRPGVFNNPGQVPTFIRYNPGDPGYATDYNNLAPNIGLSWRPNVKSGWLRTLLGDPEQATLSTGFSRSYNRERVDRFTGVYGNNPGVTVTANRNTATSGYPLVLPGESWPLLYRETARLGPPAFTKTPTLPIIATSTSDINIFDPDLRIPYTDSWQFGFQRSISQDMAVELRYIGNRNKLPWTGENWNDVNIFETNFLQEFKLAMANLKANIAAGRGATFAHFGAGTSPLPIYLAHFSGSTDASNPNAYTSTQFTNAGFVDDLDPYFPDPGGAAGTLHTGNNGVWRTNMLATGAYASNFWVLNPIVDDVNITRNLGGSNAHQFIAELRRRLSRGLQVSGSYTYARRYSKSNQELHLPLFDLRSTNVPHAFKMLWVYDLPVGAGRRFGSNMGGVANAILGGWQFSGAGRVQIQNFVLRNAVLVGMSQDEAQKALKQIRFVVDPVTGATTVWNMPQDILDNTRLAYNTDPTTPTGYPAGQLPTGRYFAPAGGPNSSNGDPNCLNLFTGDCGTRELWFNGRWFGEFDFKLEKRFPLPGRATFYFSAEVFNALTSKNFPVSFSPSANTGACGSNSVAFGRICSTQSGARTAQLLTRVSW